MIASMHGTALRSVREAKGISRAELARRSQMQANVVGWIETGRFIPYQSQLSKIADVLEVADPQSLLELV